MKTWTGRMILVGAVIGTAVGCSQQPSSTVAVVQDKSYTVTPAAVKAQVGIVSGEVTEMKVTEQVEKDSGRVVSPAKLTGTLKLKNASANQSVRLVAGKLLYIDEQGQPIQLEEARTEPRFSFTSYGNERLDPGQDATQRVDVAFPAAALQAKKLKEIRLELSYIASPYKEETAGFVVSIGGQ